MYTCTLTVYLLLYTESIYLHSDKVYGQYTGVHVHYRHNYTVKLIPLSLFTPHINPSIIGNDERAKAKMKRYADIKPYVRPSNIVVGEKESKRRLQT